jgi:hypothetical protein
MSTQNPQHSLSRVSFPKSERKTHPGATVAGKTDAQRNISVSVIVKRKNRLDLETMIGRPHRRRRRIQPGTTHDGHARPGE